jgi:poly(A) polymerase
MLMREFSSAEFDSATSLCKIIQGIGYQAVFTGGCVRDMLLNKLFNDIDIATDCPEDELFDILERNQIKTKNVGKAFGVTLAQVGNHLTGHFFEIARFRKDINCDGRHPEQVHFCSMEEDALRRDFTVNAVFYDPVADKYYDFVNGIEDIKNKKLRFVGNAVDRILEDYLRLLRYVRFYVKGFKPIKKEHKLVDAYGGEMVRFVSPERIRMELMEKLFPILKNTKVIKEFPNLFDYIFDFYPSQLSQTNQSPKWHPEGDVWTHTLRVVDNVLKSKQRTPLLTLAAILHDFGKLSTTVFKHEDKDWHSFGHEKASADIVKDWMTKYKFSNEEIAYVHWIVLNHMKLHYPGLKKSSLKRMINEGDMLRLRVLTLCDCMGACGDTTEYLEYEDRIKAILAEGTNTKPKAILTGNDLIMAGLKPGPQFSVILTKAYDHQLEDGSVTKALLLEEALKNETGT